MLARRRRPDRRLRDGWAGPARDRRKGGERSEAAGGEAGRRAGGRGWVGRGPPGLVAKPVKSQSGGLAGLEARGDLPADAKWERRGRGAWLLSLLVRTRQGSARAGGGVRGPSQPARPPRLLRNSGETDSSSAALLPRGFPGYGASNPGGLPFRGPTGCPSRVESVATAWRHPAHPAAAARIRTEVYGDVRQLMGHGRGPPRWCPRENLLCVGAGGSRDGTELQPSLVALCAS